MKTYHQIESKIDINQLFYSNDIETGQMSGCISLAYRAITQKNLQFFLQNKDKLFGHYDTKFGIDMPQKFSYTGDEHYRWVQTCQITNSHFDTNSINFLESQVFRKLSDT